MPPLIISKRTAAMNAHAVRAEFFWCYVDRLIAPSLETCSRLFDARAAAEAVFTKAARDAVVLLAHQLIQILRR
jgi:hypothetical protein